MPEIDIARKYLMEKISAVIITGDEEKNIGRCLASLVDVADEIIVVDSYSTDKTEEICKSYDVKFVKRTFSDYSDAKNHGNLLATHGYILSIDADEALSETLRESILSCKNQAMLDGYSFNRLTNYCGTWVYHCGWYPDEKMRLWKKECATWQGEIHETLVFTGTTKAKLGGDLLHYSLPSINVHAKKINYFTNMAAEDLFKRGKKASIMKLIVNPPFVFIKKFLFQKGFLHGFYGFVISMMSAYYVFYKYAKLKSLWLQHTVEENPKK